MASNPLSNITYQMNLIAPSTTDIRKVSKVLNSAFKAVNIDVRVNLTKAQSDIKRIETATKKATKASANFGEAVGNAAKRFTAYSTAVFLLLRLSNAIQVATDRAVDFNTELTKIAQTTNKDRGEIYGKADKLLDISKKYGLVNSKVAQLTRTLAQTGLSFEDAAKGAEKLAKTTLLSTFDNVSDTTEGLIVLMNTFKLSADKAGESLDFINVISKKYATESADYVQALKRAGGVFQTTGSDAKELIALFTVVRDTTRESAEVIGTGFRSIFPKLQRPKTIDYFRELGIELTKLEGGTQKFIGNLEAIVAISEGLKRLNIGPGSIKFAEVVEKIGDARQQSRVIPLLLRAKEAQDIYRESINATAQTEKDVIAAKKELSAQLVLLRANFDALVRDIVSDPVFQFLARGMIVAANAAIELVRELKPLVFLLSSIAGFRLGRTLFSGLKSSLKSGGFSLGFLGLNSGGSIPGVGNTDKIPALLTPGEYVINKQAAAVIGEKGLGNLNKLKRYNKGGPVVGMASGGDADDEYRKQIKEYSKLQKEYNELALKISQGKGNAADSARREELGDKIDTIKYDIEGRNLSKGKTKSSVASQQPREEVFQQATDIGREDRKRLVTIRQLEQQGYSAVEARQLYLDDPAHATALSRGRSGVLPKGKLSGGFPRGVRKTRIGPAGTPPVYGPFRDNEANPIDFQLHQSRPNTLNRTSGGFTIQGQPVRPAQNNRGTSGRNGFTISGVGGISTLNKGSGGYTIQGQPVRAAQSFSGSNSGKTGFTLDGVGRLNTLGRDINGGYTINGQPVRSAGSNGQDNFSLGSGRLSTLRRGSGGGFQINGQDVKAGGSFVKHLEKFGTGLEKTTQKFAGIQFGLYALDQTTKALIEHFDLASTATGDFVSKLSGSLVTLGSIGNVASAGVDIGRSISGAGGIGRVFKGGKELLGKTVGGGTSKLSSLRGSLNTFANKNAPFLSPKKGESLIDPITGKKRVQKFNFTGIDKTGLAVRDSIEAKSQRGAQRILRSRGTFISSISKNAPNVARTTFGRGALGVGAKLGAGALSGPGIALAVGEILISALSSIDVGKSLADSISKGDSAGAAKAAGRQSVSSSTLGINEIVPNFISGLGTIVGYFNSDFKIGFDNFANGLAEVTQSVFELVPAIKYWADEARKTAEEQSIITKGNKDIEDFVKRGGNVLGKNVVSTDGVVGSIKSKQKILSDIDLERTSTNKNNGFASAINDTLKGGANKVIGYSSLGFIDKPFDTNFEKNKRLDSRSDTAKQQLNANFQSLLDASKPQLEALSDSALLAGKGFSEFIQDVEKASIATLGSEKAGQEFTRFLQESGQIAQEYAKTAELNKFQTAAIIANTQAYLEQYSALKSVNESLNGFSKLGDLGDSLLNISSGNIKSNLASRVQNPEDANAINFAGSFGGVGGARSAARLNSISTGRKEVSDYFAGYANSLKGKNPPEAAQDLKNKFNARINKTNIPKDIKDRLIGLVDKADVGSQTAIVDLQKNLEELIGNTVSEEKPVIDDLAQGFAQTLDNFISIVKRTTEVQIDYNNSLFDLNKTSRESRDDIARLNPNYGVGNLRANQASLQGRVGSFSARKFDGLLGVRGQLQNKLQGETDASQQAKLQAQLALVNGALDIEANSLKQNIDLRESLSSIMKEQIELERQRNSAISGSLEDLATSGDRSIKKQFKLAEKVEGGANFNSLSRSEKRILGQTKSLLSPEQSERITRQAVQEGVRLSGVNPNSRFGRDVQSIGITGSTGTLAGKINELQTNNEGIIRGRSKLTEIQKQDLDFLQIQGQIFAGELQKTLGPGFDLLASNIDALNQSFATGLTMTLDTTRVEVAFTGADLLNGLPKEVEANLLKKVGIVIDEKIRGLATGNA